MTSPKRIVFLTGTRADFGKVRSLMLALEADPSFELFVYVTGMHLSETHGSTYQEVKRLGVKNVYVDVASHSESPTMSLRLGRIVECFTRYVQWVKPDMVVVHGDRLEPMAGALVSALNNVRLAHIEGGEITGTIDEALRHSITKLANEHFVANEEARDCLLSLGEDPDRIFVIGSPDMDAMAAAAQAPLEPVLAHYEIPFKDYGVALFHPVTSEFDELPEQAKIFVDALLASEKNWVVVYPNNDHGHEFILQEYKRLKNNPRFRLFPSVRFDAFLTLLAHAEVMVGNSSAGVREACVYGLPSIDIGTRQKGRYKLSDLKNLVHTSFDKAAILAAMSNLASRRHDCAPWGDGRSDEQFMAMISQESFWDTPTQKRLQVTQ